MDRAHDPPLPDSRDSSCSASGRLRIPTRYRTVASAVALAPPRETAIRQRALILRLPSSVSDKRGGPLRWPSALLYSHWPVKFRYRDWFQHGHDFRAPLFEPRRQEHVGAELVIRFVSCK